MTDEKTMRGGSTSEQETGALNEDALEGVAGGRRSMLSGRSPKDATEHALDWLKEKFGVDDDTELKP